MKKRTRPLPTTIKQNPSIRKKHTLKSLPITKVNTEPSNSIFPLFINQYGDLVGTIDGRPYLLNGINHSISISYKITDIKPKKL